MKTLFWSIGSHVRMSLLCCLLSFALTLSLPGITAALDYETHPVLAPCSRFSDYYDHLGFREEGIKEWPKRYHDRVNLVVEEYFNTTDIDCAAEDYEALFEPGTELLDLAAALPPFNDPETRVTRFDTGRVLLEYLRIYECALNEYGMLVAYDTAQEEYDAFGEIDFATYFLSDLMSDSFERRKLIEREKTVARTSLERTLYLIGSLDRLRPLEAELECAQRLTLDIRNLTALSAETSSCLVRTGATDVLRDYKED